MKILSELPLGQGPLHTVGGKDLCDLFDISPAALADLKKRGIAVHIKHDTYDLTATTRAYVQHLRGVASGRGGEDHILSLTIERARLAKEQADAQALKNAKLRGELVAASEVERVWADALRQLRARLLAIPARIRSELPDIDAGTIAALDRALRATLSEVGNGN